MTQKNSVLRRVRRYLENESGNFAIIFAVCAFPILGAASLAIDYSNMQRERSYVQHSLDAAALATAKQMAAGSSGEALESYARDFFEANLPSSIDAARVELELEIKSTQKTDDDGNPYTQKTLNLGASLDYDSLIATVVGHEEFALDIAAEVAMGNMTVEVALVIDNSGSMSSNNRLNLAKTTAKSLLDTVYNAAGYSNKKDPVKFALVPFAASVNVGSNYATATWMDKNGWAPRHHENLDWTTYDTSNAIRVRNHGVQENINGKWTWRSRQDVFALMSASWQGCVEMRPWPHNTLDTAVVRNNTAGYTRVRWDSADAELDKLFVPMFAPSEPYRYYTSWNSYRNRYDHYSDSDYYGYNYTYDWKRSDNVTFGSDTSNRGSNQNNRQNWIFRYQNNQLSSAATRYGQGPNYGCTTNALTPLTTTKTNVVTAIDAMQPNGMTNIQSGVSWGWRALSASEPLTGGRDYSDDENRKYMIVLTDGNNTYSSQWTPNETYYGAWGYGKHDRIEDGLSNADLAGTPYQNTSLNTYEKKMNAHTLQTCNNAKAAGVTVFTIAFDVSNGSSVKEMLNTCAGSGIVDGQPLMAAGEFYFDVQGSGLQDAMASIASQISDMRIMR
ncbi:MAG: pilus assembly protein [Rhizobiaceae bacterium]